MQNLFRTTGRWLVYTRAMTVWLCVLKIYYCFICYIVLQDGRGPTQTIITNKLEERLKVSGTPAGYTDI